MSAAGSLPAVLARGLVKRYGSLEAVAGIDLEARAGTCLGVLGPNGAGKTTTIEILEGLMDADAGEVKILEQTWRQGGRGLRERIGVQLQESRLPEKLTVQEVLELFRSFYEKGREVESVLDLVALREKRGTRTIHLSGGQRQRLALGCAIVGDPSVLFLDEPTTGLDPQARRRVWEIVETFKQAGGTVLLTTHYMDEAERLSDDLVILDHGRVIARGSPESIIASLGAESVVEITLDAPGENDLFDGIEGVGEVRHDTGRYELPVDRTENAIPALLSRLRERGHGLAHLHIHRPTLEDVFVALTGRHLRDE